MDNQTLQGYRLSPTQKWAWRLARRGPAYLAQCTATLEGDLDFDRLQQATSCVVQRHEALRTVFCRPPGMKVPFQVIDDVALPQWQHIDLSGLDAKQKVIRLEQWLRDDGCREFDFERGPLLRCALIAITPQKHIWHIRASTMCADQRTLINLVREASCYYDPRCGDPGALPDPLQYADYAEWQQQLLEADDEEAVNGQAFWRERDVSSAHLPRLPWERKRNTRDAFQPESFARRLGGSLSATVQRVARKYESDPATLLLTCWQTLLWRLSGEADVQVAYVCDGRTDAALDEAMGLFAKWLPLRIRFCPTASFAEMLALVNETVGVQNQWHDYFNSDRIRGVNADELEDHYVFEFVDLPAKETVDGVTLSIDQQLAFLGSFKVQLTCARGEAGLSALFYYDPHLLTLDDIRRLASHFVTLLKSAVSDPESSLGELEILDEHQRERLLVTFNTTEAPYPRDKGIHQLFEAQAERTPNESAVVAGGESLTYRQLNVCANQLGHYLSDHGVGAGQRVGLCVDRSVDMLVGILAILKTGAAYVALDPEHPQKRLSQQLEDIDASCVLSQARVSDALPAGREEVICIDRDQALWAGQPETNPHAVADPDEPVYVMYTSGSTGTPKGVVVTHRNLVNYTHFMYRRLRLSDRGRLHFATVSTITADLGNTCIFTSLVSGGCLHVLSYDVAADGQQFADYLSQNSVDVLKIVPSHLRALLASQPVGTSVLPREFLILGGEALSYDLVDEIQSTDTGCEVINHYGPTEATIGCMTATVTPIPPDARISVTVPIGRPIANTEAYVLDERLKPVPIGVPGELYIGGAGLAKGYLNQPQQTAERFVRHPFHRDSNARLYRTGDIVRYLPGGEVEFLGRADQQVKIRGYRIELEEIEAALGRHTSVRRAVVLAREESAGNKRLIAYVVADSEPQPSGEQLHDYLKDELPRHMIPSTFILIDSLPLTPNGKLDRQALLAREESAAASTKPFTPPQSENEALLASIWSEVLGIKDVGIHANFFGDLGGDSILSIQIVARANQAGLRLVPKQLFEHQTVAELAAVAGRASQTRAEQGPVTGDVPLTPIQRRFFDQDFADPHHWNQAVFLRTRHPLHPKRLHTVTSGLLAHHDALRLRFDTDTSGVRQFIAAVSEPTPFVYVDLAEVPEAAQRDVMEAAATELQASLNLTQGPVARVACFSLGQSDRLLVVIHHLAVDGVSWRILLEDLQRGYEQASRNQPIRFAPKTTSFKTWSEHLVKHANRESVRDELPFWLAQTQRRPRRFPVDFPDGANTVASSRSASIPLSREETDALLHEVPAVYQTQINDALLTALVLGWSRWTGLRSLVVDLEGHGREEVAEDVDLWRTVGWFTTHYPVLLELGSATEPGSALKAIKEQLRLVPHGGIGYGLLRELSEDGEIARQLRTLSQPEVCFNYLGQFDQVLPQSSPFLPAAESMGPLNSDRGHRSHALYFTGSVSGGILRLTCMYSGQQFRRQSVEDFASGVADGLRAIIDHCKSAGAGGYTVSDFSLARLDEDGLEKVTNLVEQLDAADG